MGFTVSAAAQLNAMVSQLIHSPKLVALPVDQRFAVAGKVAAVPDEHPRLIEVLASTVGTSMTEVGALNALYIMELCQELVPGFRDKVPADRLTKAAELSAHGRVQAAVLLGEKPKEWAKAAERAAPSSVVLLNQEEDNGIIAEAGRAVGDAGRAVGDVTKLVGGAALGGVGLVTDTLGVTSNAEGALADAAEDAVDLVGEGMNAVVEGVDDGITGTVGDGMADAVDMVTDFVGDAVHGIAGGVRDVLDLLAGEESSGAGAAPMATHKVAIVVKEFIGDEKSLGLRLENRIVTKFTKPEAQKFGWKLGDAVAGVGASFVASQEDMLARIAAAKEALKTQ